MDTDKNIVAFARRIETKEGMIWVPPTGRPYWINRGPNAGPDLTDEELRKYKLLN